MSDIESVGWPAGDVNGLPIPSYGNAHEAIIRAGVFGSLDTFSGHTFVSASFMRRSPRRLDKDSVVDIRHRLWEMFSVDFGKVHIRDACEHLCRQHEFNAVLDEISEVEWDGDDRIKYLLRDYCGVPHEPYHSAVSKRALSAAVRLLKEPGCQVDWSWVLQGPQNAGKTSFVRILAGQWYGEGDLLRKNEQQIQEALRGAWLYELAEGGGLHRADERVVKSIISRRDDGGRRAYGEDFIHQPRHTFLFITINDAMFLRDRSGNRRFHITPLVKLNRDKLENDRAQIWAEALKLEASGISLEIPKKYNDEADANRDKCLLLDPWLDTLSTIQGVVVSGRERVSNAMIFAHLGISKDRQTPALLHRAAECMIQLGWARVGQPFKLNGQSVRGFSRAAV